MKQMLFRVLLTSVLLWGTLSTAHAQTRQFPNSPRGQALRALVEAIESGDQQAASAYVTSHLSATLLEQTSEQAWVNRLQEIRRLLPAMGIRDLRPSGAHSLSATLYSRERPTQVGLKLTIDAQHPTQLTELELETRNLSQGPLSATGFAQELKIYIGSLAASDEFSGGALVVRNQEQIAEAYWGRPDQSRENTFNAETRFNVGSIGKTFTAVALGQLVEQGKLAWSDPVSTYYPTFPWPEYADHITIAHLLSHRSELPVWTWKDQR